MLSLIGRIIQSVGPTAAPLVDLAVIQTNEGAVLYGTTRYGGTLSAWKVEGGGAKEAGFVNLHRPDAAGAVAGLAVLDLGMASVILTGGGTGGALALRHLNDDGTFGALQTLGTTKLAGDLVHAVSVTLASGDTMVFGGMAGALGVAQLRLGANGQIKSATGVQGGHSDTISAAATAKVGAADYLFTASPVTNGVTAWRIGEDGALLPVSDLGAGQNLWVDAPSALASVQIGGITYLLIAAAGSSSISVARVGADGAMQVVDHIRDDLDSRFQAITALEIVNHAGGTWVIAGGGDDGISIWRLLPDGRLLSMGHLAEDGMANVGAISAISTSAGIEIFVASGVGGGLVHARFSPPVGQVISGAARISGGAGDDILIDGAGSTIMTGGAGRDVFVMSADGVADTITDFELGVDRIDLSAWGMIYSLDALDIQATATGMIIRYGKEVLTVHAVGGRIDPARLGYRDLLDLTRSPIVMPELPDDVDTPGGFEGGEGPDTLRGTEGDDTLHGHGGADYLYGAGGNDVLYGGEGNDLVDGGAGDDRLDGNDGNDTLFGGNGNDWMHGGPGDDHMEGGDGNDSMWGGGGNDTLIGNQMNDRLYGMDGDDFLYGGAGNDEVFGGNHNDHLYGESGNDTLHGEWGHDMIYGGDGNDLIYAGKGDDTVWGGAGRDEIIGGEGADIIYGDAGNDFISGGEGHDVLYGGDGNDWLQGGPRNDTLYGGGGNDTLIGGAWQDVLYGGAGRDVFMFRAYYDSYPGAPRDIVMDFVVGEDRIHLANLNNDEHKGGDAPLKFVGGANFSGKGAEVRTVSENGGQLVAIDLDGDGKGDMQIFFQGAAAFGADDFIL